MAKQLNRKNSIQANALANGQIWRMAESDLHIKDVGRLLVQYRLFRRDARKTVTTMSAVRTVKDYLIHNKAVLVETP